MEIEKQISKPSVFFAMKWKAILYSTLKIKRNWNQYLCSPLECWQPCHLLSSPRGAQPLTRFKNEKGIGGLDLGMSPDGKQPVFAQCCFSCQQSCPFCMPNYLKCLLLFRARLLFVFRGGGGGRFMVAELVIRMMHVWPFRIGTETTWDCKGGTEFENYVKSFKSGQSWC